MLLTGWTWVDPAASVLIALVILNGAYRVLKEAVHILNEGAPEDAGTDAVTEAFSAVAGVESIHDTHVWAIEPGYRVLTSPIVLSDRMIGEITTIMGEIKEILAHRFKIGHTTIQFECADCGQCSEHVRRDKEGYCTSSITNGGAMPSALSARTIINFH